MFSFQIDDCLLSNPTVKARSHWSDGNGNGIVAMNGFYANILDCSHWGAAMAMAKVTSTATSWNGLDTHL